MLRRLIRAEGDSLTNGIIFCNRKVDVDVVAKSLKKHGFDAAALHGDLDQSVRTRILQRFRDGELKLLIASDVAARGLDIPNVSHIFNFDVPIHSEDYVHRIGRTGRAGRLGQVDHALPAARGEVPRQDRGTGEEAGPGDGEPARRRLVRRAGRAPARAVRARERWRERGPRRGGRPGAARGAGRRGAGRRAAAPRRAGSRAPAGGRSARPRPTVPSATNAPSGRRATMGGTAAASAAATARRARAWATTCRPS